MIKAIIIGVLIFAVALLLAFTKGIIFSGNVTFFLWGLELLAVIGIIICFIIKLHR